MRKTPGVIFDMVPPEIMEHLKGIDRVIHEKNAVSPGPIGDIERPWYMHTDQKDNLVVLYGERHVDLYSVEHGKVEHFVVTNKSVSKNGVVICDYPAMLIWPEHVFHRVMSQEEGSASINFASRSDRFDIKTNFSVYDLNIETGEYHVIRDGYLDQYSDTL